MANSSAKHGAVAIPHIENSINTVWNYNKNHLIASRYYSNKHRITKHCCLKLLKRCKCFEEAFTAFFLINIRSFPVFSGKDFFDD